MKIISNYSTKIKALLIILILIFFTFELSFAATEQSSSSLLIATIAKLFFYLLSFVVVIILAFYGTKFLANKTSHIIKSKYIEIIDFISLSNNFKIYILKAFGAIYLVSISNNHIEILDKLSAEALDEYQLDETLTNNKFHDYFTNLLKNYKGNSPNDESLNADSEVSTKLNILKNKVVTMYNDKKNHNQNNEDDNYE